MQVGDLVKRTGYGAYQKIYDEEPHMGIVMDNLNGHQLIEVFWFKDNKKILTNRHVVEVVSKCK
jgi:hypothetical protein